MSVWSTYEARLGASNNSVGDPKRKSALDHAQGRISRKIIASLSYNTVKVNGEDKQVSIKDVTGDYTTKKIFSMPGDTLPHGDLIEWENSRWLVTEVDAHHALYTEGLMRRCNYYLRWVDSDGNVIGRWCVVEDGTKYLIGEKTGDMMAIGDARIAITIGKDKDTNKLSRGRRFLIDDMDSDEVLAYQITKPNKLFNVYNGKGVFRFILNEVNLTDDDNVELRIADYYSWKPRVEMPKPDTQVDDTLEQIVTDAKEKKENTPEEIKKSGVWL